MESGGDTMTAALVFVVWFAILFASLHRLHVARRRRAR